MGGGGRAVIVTDPSFVAPRRAVLLMKNIEFFLSSRRIAGTDYFITVTDTLTF